MLQVCLGCECRYSAGAPCCPQCRGAEWRPDYEEGDVAKISKLGGVSYPEDGGEQAPLADEAPEPAPESPDPTLVPASMPEPSSPESSELSGEPEAPAEAPAEAAEPEAAAAAAPPEPAPAPKPKPAPSLSRAKDAPAVITGSGGVTVPKPAAEGAS